MLQPERIEDSLNSRYSALVRDALDELRENFMISDPEIPGHPIVFASVGFAKFSGYLREEVLGRNEGMFQGPRTSHRSVMEVREALREERGVELSLLKYRKDGSPFWTLIRVCPVFCQEDGRVVHVVVVQVPIVARRGSCEVFQGSCGRELCSTTHCEKTCTRGNEDLLPGSEVEQQCQASDEESARALHASNNILAVLIKYSKSTGKLVSGKKCSMSPMGSFNFSHFCVCSCCEIGRIDPHSKGMPIVYASDAFLLMTGYHRHEVLGRDTRFLNGVETDPEAELQVKESIQAKRACTVRILNYRKDKSFFWSQLHVSPVRNATGKVAYFVWVQLEDGAKCDGVNDISFEVRQCSVVGAVKVAVRSLGMTAGSSK